MTFIPCTKSITLLLTDTLIFEPQRSFKLELFETAATKLERAVIKCSSEIEKFCSIGKKAFRVQQANQKKDEDYSDAPDHFMGE